MRSVVCLAMLVDGHETRSLSHRELISSIGFDMALRTDLKSFADLSLSASKLAGAYMLDG